jgi:predicted nucleic acid-binding protein
VAGTLAYVDTSAYLKLLFVEAESHTLEVVMTEWPELVSSELLEVEMHRATYRAGLPAHSCDELLDGVNLIALGDDIRVHAHRIAQPVLRAGDAIHLATVASLGADLGSCSPTTAGCSTAPCSKGCRRGALDQGAQQATPQLIPGLMVAGAGYAVG